MAGKYQKMSIIAQTILIYLVSQSQLSEPIHLTVSTQDQLSKQLQFQLLDNLWYHLRSCQINRQLRDCAAGVTVYKQICCPRPTQKIEGNINFGLGISYIFVLTKFDTA